jgi:hypothetical protein
MKRAYFMNVAGRTRNALVGMVFRHPPQIDLPASMEFMRSDVNGTGVSIAQMAKQSLSNLLETGRHALLVDYSGSAAGLSREQEQRANMRPNVVSYYAENLINWRTEIVNGRERLVLAVLVEFVNVAKNEFDTDREETYRVLRLRNGIYTQQLYDFGGKPTGEEVEIRGAGGQTLDYIPLYIIGSNDNLSSIDDTPLYDLSVVNIAHYRNCADLEEAAYVVGQPTLHLDLGETPPDVFEKQNPGGVVLGSRRAVVTQGGKMNLVQPDERGVLQKVKADKEVEMIRLGARLVERDRGVETAEAARINAASDASVLDTLVDNLETAMGDALRDCQRFMGVSGGLSFKLSRNYWEHTIDPQTAMAIIQFGDAGLIARSDQRRMIRRGRIELAPDRTDEQIDGEIEETAL